jgi:hypothetical protein
MSNCKNQWKLDVNDRYARGVGVVTSLSTTSLVLPIFFLKDIAKISSTQSFANSLSCWAYLGWILLTLSIISGILYFYFSAKWVKLAWEKEADIFWFRAQEPGVEILLDGSYFVMMAGFVLGVASMIWFTVTFTTNT